MVAEFCQCFFYQNDCMLFFSPFNIVNPPVNFPVLNSSFIPEIDPAWAQHAPLTWIAGFWGGPSPPARSLWRTPHERRNPSWCLRPYSSLQGFRSLHSRHPAAPSLGRRPGGSGWRASVCPPFPVGSLWLDQALQVLLRETPAAPAGRLCVDLLLRRFGPSRLVTWLLVVASNSVGPPWPSPSCPEAGAQHHVCGNYCVTCSLYTRDLVPFQLSIERNDKALFCFSWFQETFSLFLVFSYSFNF